MAINSPTKGAVGELLAAADLLKKGYEVFRAVSSACSCDLLVMKNGKILRIEVRNLEKTSFPGKLKDLGRSDHLAAVVENDVIYYPFLEEE